MPSSDNEPKPTPSELVFLYGRDFAPIKRPWGSLALAGIMLMFGVVMLGAGASSVLDGWQSHSWPSVTGTVEAAGVNEDTGDQGKVYAAHVKYSYVAVGETHLADRLSLGNDPWTSDRSRAAEEASMYSPGATITVFYDPSRPQDAVLKPGVPGTSLLLAALGLFFLACSVGLVVMNMPLILQR